MPTKDCNYAATATSVRVDRRWQVRLRTGIGVPLAPAQVWPYLSQFERFACIDLFHRSVRLESTPPRRGAGFSLEHRFLVFALERVGKILWWRRDDGFAFSDLSKRGKRVGFPHIYAFRLVPTERGCTVVLSVNGKWTARFIPRPLVLFWLYWVFSHIRFNLWKEMRRVVREAEPD